MYEWIIEYQGSQLKLTGNENKWQLLSVKGINPVAVTINSSNRVNVPGTYKTGSQTPERVLTFMIRINNPCERNRQELLNYLVPNTEVKVICRTPRKKVYVNGTISINDYDIYTSSQIMQFEVYCEHPYFIASDTRKDSNLVTSGGFSFPLNVAVDETFRFEKYSFIDKIAIYNYGQIETGMTIEVEFLDNVTKPKIYNVDNPSEYIELNDTFITGDIVKIDTNVTARSKVVLIRDGVETKIMRKLVFPVTWFKIFKVLVLSVTDANSTINKMILNIYTHDEVAGI